MTFNEKLVKLRKLKGITQDEFANAVGVSRQAVYKWESGQSYPEVPKLVEMKAIFGISIDDLLDDNYEVVLPEKKRRKRAVKEKTASEAVAVAVAEEVKVEEKVAPVKVEEPASAPAAEAPVSVKEETPKAQKAESSSEDEKKKGFFQRLFGRR